MHGDVINTIALLYYFHDVIVTIQTMYFVIAFFYSVFMNRTL